MTLAAVETRDLTRRFATLTAVSHLNLRIDEGEVFGLLGPNGSGKTTTIRMLCGLLDPSEGTAVVAGIDVRVAPERIRQHIGYMCQRFGLYEDLTAAENLGFYGGIYGLREAALATRVSEVVALLGLQPRLGLLADVPQGIHSDAPGPPHVGHHDRDPGGSAPALRLRDPDRRAEPAYRRGRRIAHAAESGLDRRVREYRQLPHRRARRRPVGARSRDRPR